MKHGIIITAVLILAAGLSLSFKDHTPNPDNYQTMWESFNKNISDNLPESAREVLDDIEKAAVKDNNQPQLLKAILYRREVMFYTVEDYEVGVYIKYALEQLDRLGPVEQAVLHEEIARLYGDYLEDHGRTVNQNIAIDGDLDNVALKYWDKKSFQKKIDEHFALALQPVKALKEQSTAPYIDLFENYVNSRWETLEPTMFEFMVHRISNYYQKNASIDDLEAGVNTESWWLPDTEFVKVKIDNYDKPLYQCLKFYQDLIAHDLKTNRTGLIYNDFKRYEFINGILNDTDRYHDVLRRLIAKSPNDEQVIDLTVALGNSLISQHLTNENDSAYFGNYKEAYDLCQQALKVFPKNNAITSLLDKIQSRELSLNVGQVQLPNENIAAFVNYRNIDKLCYTIVPVTESDLARMSNLYYTEVYAFLRKLEPVVQEVVTLPAETDFRKHNTMIALPPLNSGIYYLIVNNQESCEITEGNTKYVQFQVTNLGYITDRKDTSIELFTINRKTGYPESGVSVELSNRVYNDKKRQYEHKIIKTLKSDANGKVVFDHGLGVNSSFDVTLRKDHDLLLPSDNFYIPTKSESNPYKSTQLFTDRAIYRPGQTVYFKGIMTLTKGGVKSLITQGDERLVLKDANWQDIAVAQFTSDEYGSFSGSFVLPSNRLNGIYHINGNHGSTEIRVEEYKRPTFEILFESVKEQYKLNSDVTVRGSVAALAGFALDDVQYSYRVTRKTQFPYRCWWWWYPVVEDEQIDYGDAHTDENGKFAITFNLKPSLKTRPKQQPVFTYEIEVTATSAQGETHSNTYYIRAGYNEVTLGTTIPSLVEKSEVGKYKIYVNNMSGEPAKSRVDRKIYRFNDNPKVNYFEAMHKSVTLDRQTYSQKELDQLFPNYSFDTKEDKMNNKTLVYHDVITVDDKADFYAGKQALKPGKYYIELTSLDDSLAVTAEEFNVYDKNSNKLPYTSMCWIKSDKSTAQPGETVQFSVGSSASNVQIRVQVVHGKEVRLDRQIILNNNIESFSYTIREDDRDGINLRTVMVKENSYQLLTRYVSVPYDNLNLNVSLATVRDKLSPGSEETWTVNIKDYKDQPVKASLLAGMYDASLDEFARNYWSFNMRPYGVYSNNFDTDNHHFVSIGIYPGYLQTYLPFDFTLPSAIDFYNIYSRMMDGLVYETAVFRSEASLAKAGNAPTNGASVQMQDAAEAADEEAYLDEGSVEESGEVAEEQTQTKEEPSVRENFNETAFFFPNLRTEKDGSCSFTFTLPDAITRWRLMMLAHNQDCQTGYQEYTFKASKPVMIMADMPRYMYDTDTMWFVANVINTGEEAVKPSTKLEIFDATTMKPVDMLLSDANVGLNEILPGRSQEVRWKVAAQYDYSLLAFRFTAYAGAFSDAEQHLLPVLNSEIFMTQTLPITVKAETEKTFDFEAIANPNSRERDYSLTLNFSTNPVWYAVQSLPYLANINTKRPENAFYVFYANTLSAHIAANIPNLMAYIKKWQIETPDALLSQLEKDQDLKAILLQETPWVLDAKSESEQRSRIATLFEVNTLKQQQHETLELLEKTQMYGGGWPWFEGMPESPYITSFILSGFGKLQKMGAWTFMNKNDQRTAERICEKAVKFLEYHVAEVYREMKHYDADWGISSGILDDLYALSFFKEQNSDKDFAKAKKHFISHLSDKKEWKRFDFDDRASAAMLLYRCGEEKTAKLMIKSFKEMAMKNPEIGMYWQKQHFSYISQIATHAKIMAAFAEIDQDQETLDQLKVWLLTQKRTNRWENNASTAEAIYALLMRGSDWLDDGEHQVTLRFQETPISTEGGEAGTGFIQRRWDANEVTEDMRHLTVNNPTGHLVWGGLFRQYFVPIDEVKSDESGFKIKREIFVETVTDNGKLLVPIGKRSLKVGDKITVKLTFESSQDMSFVFVKDLRAAGFEPIEQISKYRYHDGMGYYQSNTDTDMEFFIDHLSKGVHQLQYSMFVTKEGNLSNGYALIQCEYAPEFTAYSDGMRVVVN